MAASQENRPLLNKLSQDSVSKLWFAGSVGALIVAWCALDAWNHETTSGIFQQSVVKGKVPNPFTGGYWTEVQPFTYSLTLAFLQFAFAGTVFTTLAFASLAAKGETVSSTLASLRTENTAGNWSALVGTHMFGSLLLQSLMMPQQMMSLGLFAASRAVEIPVAATVRAKVASARFGGHEPVSIGLAFAAAWLLFFSYSQIAECLCIWSGFGVALTGVPLYIVYALLLTIPPTNMVLQESMLVQFNVNPLLMQGIQNLGSALLFVPILTGAHLLGYEDVRAAASMIAGHSQIYMPVIWLCLQTTVLSAITVGLIMMLDSFWAVAARSLRVVFWWVRQLPTFYMTSTTLLSVSRPHASLWSLVMLGGIVLGTTALLADRTPCSNLSDKSAPKGAGIGRYV
jgi:hypothetical protein